MRAYERMLQYVKVRTTSDPSNESETPSTAGQFELAKILKSELEEIGATEVRMTENAYVYGTIPATPGCEAVRPIGFIAHLDTSPDFEGTDVIPVIHENYDGGRVELGHGRALDPAQFPHLAKLKGRTLITTNGSTLLGADDKAGAAEIMTLAEELLHSDLPHGRVCVAFTPDEEIGHGAELFDIPGWGAEYAYTCDGGPENELAYENFNACAARVQVKGFNIHPGDAKDKMINASLVAMELNGMLPTAETPSHTVDYEGFFHLCDMKGNVEEAEMEYIIRDHDAEHFRVRKEQIQHAASILNEKYGTGTVAIQIKEQYRNMSEYLRDKMFIVENAERAMELCGVIPNILPVRGGTDGACLTFRGLPCPNLGTGGYAFHGPYEHITVEGMDKAVEILKEIVRLTTGM